MLRRANSEVTLHEPEPWSNLPSTVSHLNLLSPYGVVTPAIFQAKYDGYGTSQDPYIISFIEDDPGDPKQFPGWKKWMIVLTVSVVSLIASLSSSSYVGALTEIEAYFGVEEEVAILGLSLFVLGLALGPLVWAPLGEIAGRQFTLCISTAGFVAFNAGVTASQNIQSLVILRFFAGVFASAPLTNASGNLADTFDPAQRGLAFGFYAASPFLGPLLGPTIGGFLGSAAGWRWVMGFNTILSSVSLVIAVLALPETFGAELLRRRARTMSKMTGRTYISVLEYSQGPASVAAIFKKNLTRPWAILFLEPIVFCLSTWISLVYGTLYLLLAGFPYVFEDARGWSPGVSGLGLLGIAIGTLLASVVNVPISRRFALKAKAGSGHPEVRLEPAIIGGLFIPAGLFWFAWTSAPSIHWIVPIIGSSLFGFGLVIVWTSVNNYIVDAYKIYAASALAGQVVWRSLFGAAFPLFTGYMYRGIGLQWASSVPAFIAAACAFMPFVFCKFGSRIRERSRFAEKAEKDTQALSQGKKKQDV